MPKRKAVAESTVDDSDLSPPPKDLEGGAAALANANADLEAGTSPAKRQKTTKSALKSDTITEATNGTVGSTRKRTTRTQKVKPEPEEEEASGETEKLAPKKRQGKTKVVKEEESEEDGSAKSQPKGRSRKKPEVKEEEDQANEDGKATKKPAPKKRKTKEEKEAEAMPLAARTVGHKLFIGAHVSSAGGQCLHMQLYNTHTITNHHKSQAFLYD